VQQLWVDDKRIAETTGANASRSPHRSCPRERKSPQVPQVLALLYLHGLSTSDLGPAAAQFLGQEQGLSASVIARLTEQWHTNARAFGERFLADP
jgi:transposase-like protein